jgi:hypothetical protein
VSVSDAFGSLWTPIRNRDRPARRQRRVDHDRPCAEPEEPTHPQRRGDVPAPVDLAGRDVGGRHHQPALDSHPARRDAHAVHEPRHLVCSSPAAVVGGEERDARHRHDRLQLRVFRASNTCLALRLGRGIGISYHQSTRMVRTRWSEQLTGSVARRAPWRQVGGTSTLTRSHIDDVAVVLPGDHDGRAPTAAGGAGARTPRLPQMGKWRRAAVAEAAHGSAWHLAFLASDPEHPGKGIAWWLLDR